MDRSRPEEHFDFGRNWLDFVEVVDQRRIGEAIAGLRRLFPEAELEGATFLDIGCGSGLSMLAALHLGARKVVGVDIDQQSVEASRQLLSRFAPKGTWTVRQASVFDLASVVDSCFDVVYSWGVLHHTGDLWAALRHAAGSVDSDGLLAVAIYRKTPLCRVWRWEKYWYSRAPEAIQTATRWIYEFVMLLRKASLGVGPREYIEGYASARGMSWGHDVHDWLGGYPYESATPEEVRAHLQGLGCEVVRQFVRPAGRGVFGSGCDEFVARCSTAKRRG